MNGCVFEGQWFDNKTNGYGKKTWPTGKIYHGQWHKNSIEGFGLMIYEDKVEYDG